MASKSHKSGASTFERGNTSVVTILTKDFTEQERTLARALFASERFGDYKVKVEIIPPLYALLVRSLREPENFKAVARALQKVGEANALF